MLTKALAIGMVAVIAGAAHSWVVGVKVGLKPRETPVAADPGASPKPPDQPGSGPVDPATLGQFISLAEAHALFEAGVLFIDTRTLEQFNQGHILGAYHLSTVELAAGQAGEVLSLLSSATHYVLYCDGGECEASENVAQRLEDAFPLYHIMKDGFPAWQAAGYDIELPDGGKP